MQPIRIELADQGRPDHNGQFSTAEIFEMQERDKPREECGVAAYFTERSDTPVGQLLFAAGYAMQHRGEESAGVVVYQDHGELCGIKGPGLFQDVMVRRGLEIDGISPAAVMGISHGRYGTSGGSELGDIQPFEGQLSDFILAHNGNIANAPEVSLHFGIEPHPDATDTKITTDILDYLTAQTGSIHAALDKLLPLLEGSYCFVIADGTQIIAVRDPNGIRPLCMGIRPQDGGYIIASETPAIRAAGAKFWRDIEPGEIVTIDKSGVHSRPIDKPVDERLCAFEFVYTARADGELRGRNVGLARKAMGAALAMQAPVPENSMVIGMPDTGVAAASGFAHAANLYYEPSAVVKDRYISRSFQMATQIEREFVAGIKYQINPALVEGQHIVVVDDSIVRGTTMRKFVSSLRAAGAASVHLRIPCPPIKFPCYMGVDIGDSAELIANKMTIAEMRDYFEVDSLAFLEVERWKQAIGLEVGKLCTACVSGEYPIKLPERLLSSVPVQIG